MSTGRRGMSYAMKCLIWDDKEENDKAPKWVIVTKKDKSDKEEDDNDEQKQKKHKINEDEHEKPKKHKINEDEHEDEQKLKKHKIGDFAVVSL
jgi:hypothetical protein